MSQERTSGRFGRKAAPAWEQLRADYAAARESRFRRRRTGIQLNGSSADYHYRNDTDYLRILEYARDFDRNDIIISGFVDRVVSNTIQGGFALDPQTGDAGLDKAIWDRWDEWTNDPRKCDIAGQMTFSEIETLLYRMTLVDGDAFVIPTNGALQIVEGHRPRTPFGKQSTTVLGVELDDYRRPIRYYFSKDEIDPTRVSIPWKDLQPYDALDADGRPMVFHILLNQPRPSLTRGVSAFSPCFDAIGMFEDINFSKIVQQAIAACIGFTVEKDKDFKGDAELSPFGAKTNDSDDGQVVVLENMAPGMMVRPQPGEVLKPFTPNVNIAEWNAQAEMILNLISINLGLPLMLALLRPDGSYTAYRGAIDQARLGFQSNQKAYSTRLHKPVYRYKLDQWADEDRGFRVAQRKLGRLYYNHRFNLPTWPYIDPSVDAQSDLLQVANGLLSPRRMQANRGRDHEEVATESVLDKGFAVRAAKREAAAINSEFKDGDPVQWRELCSLPVANGQTLQIVPPNGDEIEAKRNQQKSGGGV